MFESQSTSFSNLDAIPLVPISFDSTIQLNSNFYNCKKISFLLVKKTLFQSYRHIVTNLKNPYLSYKL